jgi:CBS domain-containing protein
MKSSVPISALLHHKGTALWSITPELTVFEAIKLMADKNIGALLVLAGGKLVGIFTERDYTRKIALQGKSPGKRRCGRSFPARLFPSPRIIPSRSA